VHQNVLLLYLFCIVFVDVTSPSYTHTRPILIKKDTFVNLMLHVNWQKLAVPMRR